MSLPTYLAADDPPTSGYCPKCRGLWIEADSCGTDLHSLMNGYRTILDPKVFELNRTGAPAGPPLHEQADRDADNVPSDEEECPTCGCPTGCAEAEVERLRKEVDAQPYCSRVYYQREVARAEKAEADLAAEEAHHQITLDDFDRLRKEIADHRRRTKDAEAEVERLRGIVDRVNDYADQVVRQKRWVIALDIRTITAGARVVVSPEPTEEAQ